MRNPSRREFVLSSTGGMAVAAWNHGRLLGKGKSDSKARVRVGIIGSTGRGDYGHGVDVAFKKLENVELVALADADDAGRAAAIARTHPRQAYADYREMLAEQQLDVVAICPRWVDQHHDMIIAAAQAGCHVYMEKPFCPTLLDCDNVIRELESRDLKLGIAHISQYSPVLDMVQRLIAADEIGEVLELRGRGKEDHRGGGEDLWVLGSHVFGLMRTLAGGDALSCSASLLQNGKPVTRQHVVEGAEGIGPLAGDHVEATYSFPSGAVGYFASRRSLASKPSRFAIQIFGSKGIVEMETGYGVQAHILRDSSWSPGRSGKAWEPVTSAGIGQREPRGDGTYEGGHLAAINDLLDSIEQGRQPKCSAYDARSIVEMIVAVFESHRIGGPVELPLVNRLNPLTQL